MSKRAGPPLFELLREQGQGGAERAPTPSDPEPTVPWSSGGVTRAERSAATFESEPKPSGEFRVSAPRLYLAIAVASSLIVVAWVAGYRIGQRAGRAEMTPLVRDESVVTPQRLADPATAENRTGGTVPGTVPGAGTAPDRSSDPNRARPETGRAGGVVPKDWVLHADGLRAADPRVPGSNYLELATLPADQAGAALAYLAGRGVRAIGVPVDLGTQTGNNPARYTLYSLGLAVPSGQYSSTGSERRDHERLVASIGADWMRDQRGGSNFSQTLWRKYDP